jgi:hypothetical protein
MGRQARWRFGDPLRVELDVTLYDPPVIERQPVPWIGPEGSEARLTVEASSPSGELSYAWLRNGLELREHAPYEGTASPTLRITPTSEATQGEYICVLRSPAGVVTTPPATVRVESSPASPRVPARRLGRTEAARKLMSFLAGDTDQSPPPSRAGQRPDRTRQR